MQVITLANVDRGEKEKIPSSSQSEQHLRPEEHAACHIVVGNAWHWCPTQART